MPRTRKLNDDIKSFLMNDLVYIVIRYIKESGYDKVFYKENSFDKIYGRIKCFSNEIGFKSPLNNIFDVMKFEIGYYEFGSENMPSGPFSNRHYTCRTKIGKIAYCLSFFIEDLFGITLTQRDKHKIIDDIIEIVLKI